MWRQEREHHFVTKNIVQNKATLAIGKRYYALLFGATYTSLFSTGEKQLVGQQKRVAGTWNSRQYWLYARERGSNISRAPLARVMTSSLILRVDRRNSLLYPSIHAHTFVRIARTSITHSAVRFRTTAHRFSFIQTQAPGIQYSSVAKDSHRGGEQPVLLAQSSSFRNQKPRSWLLADSLSLGSVIAANRRLSFALSTSSTVTCSGPSSAPRLLSAAASLPSTWSSCPSGVVSSAFLLRSFLFAGTRCCTKKERDASGRSHPVYFQPFPLLYGHQHASPAWGVRPLLFC